MEQKNIWQNKEYVLPKKNKEYENERKEEYSLWKYKLQRQK